MRLDSDFNGINKIVMLIETIPTMTDNNESTIFMWNFLGKQIIMCI
jgi:hypothetical protein